MKLCFSIVAKIFLGISNQTSLCPATDNLKIQISNRARK